jgi:hypothetical protein
LESSYAQAADELVAEETAPLLSTLALLCLVNNNVGGVCVDLSKVTQLAPRKLQQHAGGYAPGVGDVVPVAQRSAQVAELLQTAKQHITAAAEDATADHQLWFPQTGYPDHLGQLSFFRRNTAEDSDFPAEASDVPSSPAAESPAVQSGGETASTRKRHREELGAKEGVKVQPPLPEEGGAES